MSPAMSDRVQDLLERAGLDRLQPRTQKAVVALAALAVVLGLWRFWPAAPAPEVAFDDAETQVAGDPEVGTTADARVEVVVHVVGAVMRPGVYALPAGSRATDAIEAAGGGLGNASLHSLNLARILADGEQIYVPTADEVAAGSPANAPGVSGASGGGTTASGLVDINRASAAELDALPGVGPSTAQKIVDDREANGPFATPEDLMRVSGIGAKKFDALKDLVTCG